jgi:hypothetical protein
MVLYPQRVKSTWSTRVQNGKASSSQGLAVTIRVDLYQLMERNRSVKVAPVVMESVLTRLGLTRVLALLRQECS